MAVHFKGFAFHTSQLHAKLLVVPTTWMATRQDFSSFTFCILMSVLVLLVVSFQNICQTPVYSSFLFSMLQVFNFTLGVKVEQHSQPLGKAEQDMTKLCNHRRKVVAMAALCRSMQVSQLPFANLQYSGMFFQGMDPLHLDQFVHECSHPGQQHL